MKSEARATWTGLLRRLAPLLPADLFDQLRAAPSPETFLSERTARSSSERSEQALAPLLQQAIADLGSLRHTLTTFLPRYLLDLAPTPGESNGELLEGSFIFADVTGFTALTGELSKQGTAGREEMNRLMRELFAAILEPLLASGGDLLFFAGDAVLAFFPAQTEGAEGQDAHWATRTALRMVRAIEPFARLETPYGAFSLTMSAGVERGTAFAAVVGTRHRMELLLSGGPVQGATVAEALGEPGQVVAGPGIQPFLPTSAFLLQGPIVEGIRGGSLDYYEAIPPTRRRKRLSALFSRRIPDLLKTLEEALTQVEALVPFIPPDLFIQIARGEDIRQHPPVAVQFVNLIGIEEMALGPAGPAKATSILQRYFVQAQEIVAEREGIISQVDPYVKGFTLLNPFGAPTHHEGVPRLAASAALEMNNLIEQVNREFRLDPPLTQRIGMTYDRIFTGEIGYRHRREYVVAGPAVNLAARLMSKSEPGQIVLDPGVWAEVEEDFIAQDLPPIPLKGIPDPVPRFNLQKLRRGKGLHLSEYPITVRQEERAALEQHLDGVIEGHGKALALLGETGYGKSRLAAALAEAAKSRGMTILSGRCRTFGQAMPYLPWSELITRWFDLDEDLSIEERRRRLREQLVDFGLSTSLPAFADLLGLPRAMETIAPGPKETTGPKEGVFARLKQEQKQDVTAFASLLSQRVAEAEATAPAEAKRSVWDLLRERASIPHALHLLLKQQAFRQPTLLIIEDIQWIDPESQQILETIKENVADWPLLLLVTARPGVEWEGEEFIVPPLNDEDTQTLAALALRANSLAPSLAEWLIGNAGGNPLFIFSYCRALRDTNAVVVDPVTGAARWSGPPPPLPRTLQELLLAQIGRLDSQTQGVLRRGAVVGDPFDAWLVERLYPSELFTVQVDTLLGQAARRSLIAPPPVAPAHHFNSHSLHDAIYETLSHALRERWHELLGDMLTDVDVHTRYEQLEQIAHHYARSGNAQKAAHFTRLAGDKARARQAEEAALTFYNQTLAATEDELTPERRLAQEGIGDVHALRGDATPAYDAYSAALEGAPPSEAVRLRAKIALLSPLVDQPDLDLIQQTRDELTPSDPLIPWVCAALVWTNVEAGDEEAAITECRGGLGNAEGATAILLQETLEALEGADPLSPYEDFFALFARSYLRRSSGGES